MTNFIAAAAARLTELRAAARSYLAWKSIVGDHVVLDLTAHQKKQADSKVLESKQQVDSLIAETFTQVLTPTLEPGTSDIKWQTTRAMGNGDIAARVSKKLATEEKLIAVYGGVRVRMDIDRHDLWSDRHDMGVGDLWAIYARFPHMPRVASRQRLSDAISDGTSNMNWTQETFGYADAHNGTTWVGVRTGEHLVPVVGGLLIHPEHIPDIEAGGDGAGAGGGGDGDAVGGAGGAGDGARGRDSAGGEDGNKPSAKGVSKQQFYAQFNLDPVRGIKQLGEILEHVARHLGPDLKLSLEINAKSEDGFDDGIRRTVAENANNLEAKAAEFE